MNVRETSRRQLAKRDPVLASLRTAMYACFAGPAGPAVRLSFTTWRLM